MASYTFVTLAEDELKRQMYAILDRCMNAAIKTISANEYFAGGEVVEISIDGYSKAYEISTNTLKAWIVEYGQGEGIDFNRLPREYWNEYKGQGLTAAGRNSGTIHSRPGIYRTIDFDEGKVVERTSSARHGGEIKNTLWQQAHKVEPTPFIDDLLEKAYQTFVSTFNKEVKDLNIVNCMNFKTMRV